MCGGNSSTLMNEGVITALDLKLFLTHLNVPDYCMSGKFD